MDKDQFNSEELVRKITGIQNKSKTLKWGYVQHSETEHLFVVGNSAYPGRTYCFIVNEECEISMATDDWKKELLVKCSSCSDVVGCVIGKLKEWFPARGQ